MASPILKDFKISRPWSTPGARRVADHAVDFAINGHPLRRGDVGVGQQFAHGGERHILELQQGAPLGIVEDPLAFQAEAEGGGVAFGAGIEIEGPAWKSSAPL